MQALPSSLTHLQLHWNSCTDGWFKLQQGTSSGKPLTQALEQLPGKGTCHSWWAGGLTVSPPVVAVRQPMRRRISSCRVASALAMNIGICHHPDCIHHQHSTGAAGSRQPIRTPHHHSGKQTASAAAAAFPAGLRSLQLTCSNAPTLLAAAAFQPLSQLTELVLTGEEQEELACRQ